MFLKLLVCLFSICIFIKSIYYSIYEYNSNKNSIGAISNAIVSLVSILTLNIVLFFIKF